MRKYGWEIEAGAGQTIDLPLRVSFEKQELTVEDESSEGVSVDPQSNVGAIILRGEDLDALSDDPDDLAADLQALAGPLPPARAAARFSSMGFPEPACLRNTRFGRSA